MQKREVHWNIILIRYVNNRNIDIGGRHFGLFGLGAAQRFFGHAAAALVLGVVRHLNVHPASVRNDCGVCVLQGGQYAYYSVTRDVGLTAIGH